MQQTSQPTDPTTDPTRRLGPLSVSALSNTSDSGDRIATPLLQPRNPANPLDHIASIIKNAKSESRTTSDMTAVEDLRAAEPPRSPTERVDPPRVVPINETAPLMPETASSSCLGQFVLSAKSAFSFLIYNPLTAFKIALSVPMLSARFLTCIYRALPNEDAIRLFFQMPGLDRWSDQSWVTTLGISFGSFFAFTDAIQTILVSRKKIFDLCTHPNWFQKIKDFLSEIRNKEYPIAFLALFLVSILPSGWNKAQVGLTDGVQRLAGFSGHTLSNASILSTVIPIALLSCFCSSVFTFQKSAWVVRAYRELEKPENKGIWYQYHKDNWWWFFKLNLIGISQAILGAFSGGTALFYEHHKFQFEMSKLIFFLIVGLASILFNFMYSYNPVYKLECLLELKEKQDAEERVRLLLPVAAAQVSGAPEAATASTCLSSFWSGFKRFNAFCSVAGGSVMMFPTLIRSLQILLMGLSVATNNDRYKNASESPYLLVPAALVSILFMWGSFKQGMAMWSKPLDEDKSVQPSQVIRSDEDRDQPHSAAPTLAIGR